MNPILPLNAIINGWSRYNRQGRIHHEHVHKIGASRQGHLQRTGGRLISTGKALGLEYFELHATKAGEPVYQKLGFLLHDEPTYRISEETAVTTS